MFQICGKSSRPNLFHAVAVFFVVLAASGMAGAQSEPLGDVAREIQQKKADSAPPKVFTNADLPKNPDGYTAPPGEEEQTPSSPAQNGANWRAAAQQAAQQRAAEQWRRTILAQKNLVANQQGRVDDLQAEIRLVNPNTAYDYYSALNYNQGQLRQMRLLHQLERQLDQQKHRLAEMQEAAHRAGMHSAVYDP